MRYNRSRLHDASRPRTMPEESEYRSLVEWTAEDFAESDNEGVQQDDPWTVGLGQGARSRNSGTGLDNSGKEQIPPVQGVLPLLWADSEGPGDSRDGEWGLLDLESREEFGSLEGIVESGEWDDSDLVSSQFEDATSLVPDLVEGYDSDFDEPEPIAEYDPDLRQRLFASDFGVTDLSRKIKTDELVAGVLAATDAEREIIRSLLDLLSVHRLGSWLPWLREKRWTGRTLVLFLEFRAFWDDNSHLWERLWWSRDRRYWSRVFNRNVLSLDASYELVHRRLHCPPEEVNDEGWLDDWEDVEPWVLVGQGFFSFSAFALYRSSLRYAEDWLYRPDLQVDFKSPNSNDWSRTGVSAFNRNLPSLISWFEGQDWYDPAGWHDNLGWMHHVVIGEHPYLRSGSLDF